MPHKKMEGNETQRRKAAREARAAGTTPSAENATTGASKQPHTRPEHEPHHHAERLSDIHRGKQQDTSPDPKPGYGKPSSKRHGG
ncbi:hypothetical protein [Thermomonospora umbrina]|uniref:Uncharacterized protein n=1 Tax=Thermomonospora umbrina TaxID=111806 RepID=A0A3D9SZE7_9ACTN|nr:hypothetical protein [Thermomonospora umbrina]REE99940.1 hypothetical protein DFJ69_5458 [Thermomonospora umbrina]